MKNRILVYPHSVVDLITNSSTEIFVANRGHTIEEVRSIVDHLKDIFYVNTDYGYGNINIEEVSDGWDEEYYGKNSVVIAIDYYTIPTEMEVLLRAIFDSGERNEPEIF